MAEAPPARRASGRGDPPDVRVPTEPWKGLP